MEYASVFTLAFFMADITCNYLDLLLTYNLSHVWAMSPLRCGKNLKKRYWRTRWDGINTWLLVKLEKSWSESLTVMLNDINFLWSASLPSFVKWKLDKTILPNNSLIQLRPYHSLLLFFRTRLSSRFRSVFIFSWLSCLDISSIIILFVTYNNQYQHCVLAWLTESVSLFSWLSLSRFAIKLVGSFFDKIIVTLTAPVYGEFGSLAFW